MASAEEFTTAVAAALREQFPDTKIERLGSLELRVDLGEGDEVRLWLGRAFEKCQAAPDRRAEFIQEVVEAARRSAEVGGDKPPGGLPRERILPVLRTTAWLERVTAEAARLSAVSGAFASIPLNEELVVMLAEEDASTRRFMRAEELRTAGVDEQEALALAMENLKQRVGQLQVHAAGGFYIVEADQQHEASLILSERLWEQRTLEVAGDYIFGVPQPNLLFVTGSDDEEGLRLMARVVEKAVREGPDSLTATLFRYEQGRIRAFGP